MVRLVARRRARWRRARPTALLSPLGPPLGTARSGPVDAMPPDGGGARSGGTASEGAIGPDGEGGSAGEGGPTAGPPGTGDRAASAGRAPVSSGPSHGSRGAERAAASTGPGRSTARDRAEVPRQAGERPPVLAPPVRIRVLRTVGEVAEARARAADQLRRIEAAMGPGVAGRSAGSVTSVSAGPLASGAPAPGAPAAPAPVATAPPVASRPSMEPSAAGEPRSDAVGPEPDQRSDGPSRR
jgi:hypothetical protein